jgi:hypothetical protein
MDIFRIRYVGEDGADIRKGEVYSAKEVPSWNGVFAVLDRSGEWYIYPEKLFEKVED